MITEIRIENFKSIVDLTLKPGRVTVLIGENGSGKSNILEAVAFGAGAAGNKLDQEFLFSRGIRVAESEWMQSAFLNSPNVHLKFITGDDHPDEFDWTISPAMRTDKSFDHWTTLISPDSVEIEKYSGSERVRKLVDQTMVSYKRIMEDEFNRKKLSEKSPLLPQDQLA